jgi:hypothetical protein
MHIPTNHDLVQPMEIIFLNGIVAFYAAGKDQLRLQE